jgi:anti-sigma regulatory factor (Ser/Thr protein kinase)
LTQAGPLELELTSDPPELPRVRVTVRDWSAQQGWSDDQAAEIALAVDEALSNVIRHGYCCAPGQRILLTAQPISVPGETGGLEIRIRDFGKQADPDQIRGRQLDDIRPGGLGVHIIRAMMSSVEYQPAPGGGMLLVMRKYKDHRAACPEANRHD